MDKKILVVGDSDYRNIYKSNHVSKDYLEHKKPTSCTNCGACGCRKYAKGISGNEQKGSIGNKKV